MFDRPIFALLTLLALAGPAVAQDANAEPDAETAPITHGIDLTGQVGLGFTSTLTEPGQTGPETLFIGRLQGEVSWTHELDNGLSLGFRFPVDERIGD